MNAERVTNKKLNRRGWHWAVKFDNVADDATQSHQWTEWQDVPTIAERDMSCP